MELPGSAPATAHLKLENPVFIKNTQGVVTSVCHQNIAIYKLSDMHDGTKQVFGRFTVFLTDGQDLIKIQIKGLGVDRKSTRLNSSHVATSYAVFCLKKKSPCPTGLGVMGRPAPRIRRPGRVVAPQGG